MMRLALAAMLLLAGCSQDPLEQAKERYAFLEKNGASSQEKCTQARKAAEIAADQKKDTEYLLWRITANNDCNPL